MNLGSICLFMFTGVSVYPAHTASSLTLLFPHPYFSGFFSLTLKKHVWETDFLLSFYSSYVSAFIHPEEKLSPVLVARAIVCLLRRNTTANTGLSSMVGLKESPAPPMPWHFVTFWADPPLPCAELYSRAAECSPWRPSKTEDLWFCPVPSGAPSSPLHKMHLVTWGLHLWACTDRKGVLLLRMQALQ